MPNDPNDLFMSNSKMSIMKTNYCITYDLNKPGQDYDDLIEAIKSYDYIKVMKSTWFIKTTLTSTQIREHLMKHMDKNDSLFICEITSNRDGWLAKEVWEWLKK